MRQAIYPEIGCKAPMRGPFFMGGRGGSRVFLDEPHAPNVGGLVLPAPPAQPPQGYPHRVVGPGEWGSEGANKDEPHAPDVGGLVLPAPGN